MIPNYQDLHATTSGVEETRTYGISIKNSAHIMKILRDQLYSDKKMAVLREYSANAWDANREAGNGDKPIKVTLPTVTSPTLVIRDYGPGISHTDVFDIYVQYGESTKRTKDGQVGMLGIGSKSGFAYTDSFTVTTWQDGCQRIYTALLDTGAGSMNLLDACPSDEPNGTEIQIPVRPQDIPEFVQKAEHLFIHFKPRPELNISLPPEVAPEAAMQHGTIVRGGEHEWYAVMGCIAYKLDLSQLRGLNAYRGGAGDFLDRLSGYLYFNIGDVEIAANREALEYSDKTKAVLIDKFIDLVDEFVQHTLTTLEIGDFTGWEKRCRAQVLHELGLPIPPAMELLVRESFVLEEQKLFTVTYGIKQSAVKHIKVHPNTRLIVRDEVRRIDGYSLGPKDYIIRPNKDVRPVPTAEQIRTELDSIVGDQKVHGIPIINISTLQWHPKNKFQVTPARESNKKHTVKTFVLDGEQKYFGSPYSDCWDIETITPSDDDVFVLLNKFKVLKQEKDKTRKLDEEGGTVFYFQYPKDRAIAKPLGFKMPKIYGYKSTEKAPVKEDSLQGKHYSEWRLDFLQRMAADPKVNLVYESLNWIDLIIRTHGRYAYRNTEKIDPRTVGVLFKELGKDHEICCLFRKIMLAKRVMKKTPSEIIQAVRGLREAIVEAGKAIKSPPTQQDILKNKILAAYPMLELVGDDDGIKALLEDDTKTLNKLLEYIKLVDLAKKGLTNEQGTITHADGRVGDDRLEGESTRSEEGGAQLHELGQSDQEGEGGRGLVEDRGPSISVDNGEGLVQRQIPAHGELRTLLRAAGA